MNNHGNCQCVTSFYRKLAISNSLTFPGHFGLYTFHWIAVFQIWWETWVPPLFV